MLINSATIDASKTDFDNAQYSDNLEIQNIPSDKVVFLSFSRYINNEDIGLTVDSASINLGTTAKYLGFEITCTTCKVEIKENPMNIQTWIIDSDMCHGLSYLVQGSDYFLTVHSFTNKPEDTLCLFVQSSFRAMTMQQNVRGYNERSTTIMRPEEIASIEEPIYCDELDCVNGLQGPFFVFMNGSIINYELIFKYYIQADPVYYDRDAVTYYKVTSKGLSTDTTALMRVTLQASIAAEIGVTTMSEGSIMIIILGSLVIIGIFVAISLCIVKCCTGCCYFCPCFKWSAEARKERLEYQSQQEGREVVRTVVQTSPQIQLNIHPMRSKTTVSSPTNIRKDDDQHDDPKEDQEAYQI